MSLDLLFVTGRVFSDGAVATRHVGVLTLASGKVRVGDPASSPAEPFARGVAPGSYPVSVSVASSPNADTRVAAARVVFSAEPIVRWEPALPAGKDPKDLEPGEYFGYGVDAGLAAFADAEARWGYERYEEEVLPAIEQALDQTHAWSAHGDLVAFTSGAGDDFYVSFWGLDKDDRPVCLVTEFRIVGMDETKGAELLAKDWPGTPPPPGDLSPFFQVGADLGGAKVVRLHDVGNIDVSGYVVAGPARDLLVLARKVPAGEYPVRLSIANGRLGAGPADQVAAIAVQFSDAPIALWELAAPRGLDLGAMPDERNPGLGFHCEDEEPFYIADDGARSTLNHALRKMNALVPEGSRRKWAAAIVQAGRQRVVGLRAGVGGGYLFWALDAAGAPVMLVGLTSQIGWKATRPFDIIEKSKSRARD